MGRKSKKYQNRQKKAANAGKSNSEPSTLPNPDVPSLPQEVMMGILSRLPVKSLVSLKVVCNDWRRLVTSQEFIKIHCKQFSETQKTYSPHSHILQFSRLGLLPSKKEYNPSDFVLETCRGLVCMSRPLCSDRIILWNPATRMWKLVPPLIPPHRGNIDFTSMGFGCNEEGDDYKVVRIHLIAGNKRKVYVEVYSSKMDGWTTVNAGLRFQTSAMMQSAEVRGHPYWVVFTEEYEIVLLRFDSTKMSFETIETPPQIGTGTMRFVDLEGKIGALHHFQKRNYIQDKIDAIAYEEGEWVLKWRIIGQGDLLRGVEECASYSWRKCRLILRRSMPTSSLSVHDLEGTLLRLLRTERVKIGYAQSILFEETLGHVRGMAAMDLAMPVAEEADELNECIEEGFLTWGILIGAGSVQVYYPLAS